MNKRRAKSRMTRVDLNAVLKLQRDYTVLQSECSRLCDRAIEHQRGNFDIHPHTIFTVGDLNYVYFTMLDMGARIKELEQRLEQVTNGREIENGGV